ncbi:Uncharacterized protein DAT39_014773, partial [Clarias magur]
MAHQLGRTLELSCHMAACSARAGLSRAASLIDEMAPFVLRHLSTVSTATQISA